MREAGLPEKNVDRKAIEQAMENGDPEVAVAFSGAVVALFAILSKLAHGNRDTDELRPFKTLTPASAKQALASFSPVAESAKRADGLREAGAVWVTAAEKAPPSTVAWLVRRTSESLNTAATDVGKLFEKMEQAKESIKMEKIAFAEALGEEEASAYGEMRSLGIQSINDQILEYDKRLEEAMTLTLDGDADPNAEPESSYDTLEHFDDDDGIDYD